MKLELISSVILSIALDPTTARKYFQRLQVKMSTTFKDVDYS